jgi:hypothetical protein
MRREMRQFVKTDQGDLRALLIVNGGVKLQMSELDLAAAWPAPLAHADVRGTTELWIEIPALIPKGTGIGDLGHGAPEEDGGEVRDAVDMA